MKTWVRAAALVSLAVSFASPALASSEPLPPVSTTPASPGVEAVAAWIVDRADNICGLDDPKMLSKPAKVDYDSLLRATPELRKIKDDKIDPNSPQGIQLRQAAATRVQKAADKVRGANGHCSVWKAIRHQDGRAVADITDAVKAELPAR